MLTMYTLHKIYTPSSAIVRTQININNFFYSFTKNYSADKKLKKAKQEKKNELTNKPAS